MRIQSIRNQITYAGKIPVNKDVGISSKSKNVVKKLKQANKLTEDTCKFILTDKSLDPVYLKDLLHFMKVIPSRSVAIMIVKNQLLKAMGYKQPEALKLVFEKNGEHAASYNPIFGIITIDEGKTSDEEIIAMFRHELEHMTQDVKLYKALGEDKFLEASVEVIKQKNPDVTIQKLKEVYNKTFYETMSKDADITNFDAEKYYEALCEYPLPSKNFSLSYKYYNNLLEKDAYTVEKKVLKALGRDPVTAADFFPKNYKTMIELLKKSNYPKEMYDFLLYSLKIFVHLENIKKPGDVMRFLKIWNDISSHKVTPKDMIWWNKTSEAILDKQPTFESLKKEQEYYQSIESMLKDGKYTINDILKDLL